MRILLPAILGILLALPASGDELDGVLDKLARGFSVAVDAKQTSGRGRVAILDGGRLRFQPGGALELRGSLQVGGSFSAPVHLLVDPDQLFLSAGQGLIAVHTDLRASDVPADTRRWLAMLASKRPAASVAARLRKQNTIKSGPGRLTFVSKSGGARAVVELDSDGLPSGLSHFVAGRISLRLEFSGWRLGPQPTPELPLPEEQYQETPFSELGDLPRLAQSQMKAGLGNLRNTLQRVLEDAMR